MILYFQGNKHNKFCRQLRGFPDLKLMVVGLYSEFAVDHWFRVGLSEVLAQQNRRHFLLQVPELQREQQKQWYQQ